MEWKKAVIMVMAIVLLWGLVQPSWAQRGMGDASGVVQQGLRPEIVTLKGKVLRVITGPCAQSTGRFGIGTHFILQPEHGPEQNVHLGPAHLVQAAVRLLAQGEAVSVQAFRTEKMPPGHYNAITLTLDKQTICLRDQTLKPVWAGQAPLRVYGSEMGWPSYGAQRSVYRSRQVGAFLGRGPSFRCRGGYSWGRKGRGRGRGRRWGCQAGPRGLGRQWRAWP